MNRPRRVTTRLRILAVLPLIAIAMLVVVLVTRRDEPTGPFVTGTVLAGPTCPVARPGDPACAPQPVAARVRFEDATGRAVATATSGADGGFRARVPSGTYTVVAGASTGGQLPRGIPATVSVPATGIDGLQVAMDTGIR